MLELLSLDRLMMFGASGAPDPVAHVVNHKLFDVNGLWIWSGNVGNLILSGIILIVGFKWIAGKIDTGPESAGHERYVTRGAIPHMVEVICVYLREEMCRPLLHDRTDRMMPFLWTLFYFILINNLLGLIPLVDIQHLPELLTGGEPHWAAVGGTATQNLFVTGSLALVCGLVINVAAIRRLGIGGYLHHQTGGAPWYVWPIVFPIELAGNLLIKPVALAIRLFANMTAGHILLAVLFSFVGGALSKGLVIGASVTLISVAGATAIFFLEIFVAFLQAFIFMFLTTVFVSLLDHHEEHGHEDHGDEVPAGAVPAH